MSTKLMNNNRLPPTNLRTTMCYYQNNRSIYIGTLSTNLRNHNGLLSTNPMNDKGLLPTNVRNKNGNCQQKYGIITSYSQQI